jgi:RNA-directed DNA polymerase
MEDTPRSQTVSTKLEQIAEQARAYPDTAFTTLIHLIDEEFLREAFHRTKKDAAPGVDRVTATKYAKNLDENLANLYERLRKGQYRATPVKRVWLDKDDGRKRPIGITTLEDKIVQRAVAMILVSIYEQEFYEFSYGFRPNRNPHQALHELRERCMEMGIGWIVDLDVCGFFDNIEHDKLREILKQRVNDGGIIRLIGKWLNAGVIDGEELIYPEKGTPQGGVISPVLANVFLHHVLDDWFEREIKPRMRGPVFLIRFADDAVIGCVLEHDARRIMEVLPKRFARFGLAVNPVKTKMVRFKQPNKWETTDRKNEAFDFLGFTHYWAKSRRGNWVIKRKTAKKRLQRSMKMFWQWCRQNRHLPLKEQHKKLCQKLRGYYQYYAIRDNSSALRKIYRHVERAWRYWLSRRTRKSKIPWEKCNKLWRHYSLPNPKIIHYI